MQIDKKEVTAEFVVISFFIKSLKYRYILQNKTPSVSIYFL